MVQKYFLGANSEKGFYSLCNIFPPAEDDFLHIIKAGPGGGKSGFMRMIGKEAEKNGLDVHYIPCSGDPESLDGVYIPQLKAAWTDGTSPHCIEPGVYGADSDYVMLSEFFISELEKNEKYYVNLYTRLYRDSYKKAYTLLSACASLVERSGFYLTSTDDNSHLYEIIEEIFNKFPIIYNTEFFAPELRFLSCISCLGHYRLIEEIYKLCKLTVILKSSVGADIQALDYAAEKAQKHGEKALRILSPLSPEKLTALILPERGLGLLSSGWENEFSTVKNLDACLVKGIAQSEMQTIFNLKKQAGEAFALALNDLRAAKDFHDKLEAVYKPHINFKGMEDYTCQLIRTIFS